MTAANSAPPASSPPPGDDAIRSPAGTPLIERDHHLAPALIDTLLRQKLLASEDEFILPGEALTPEALARAANELLAREPLIAELMPSTTERRQLTHILAALPLSDRIIVKLTTAATDRSDLLNHSLRVAFCAAALAQRLHMAHHEVAEAVAAGLFHDLGLLHVDPALLQSGRRLEEHERHYLDTHPLTGYMMLEGETVWHPLVSNAVLEHHERIDGSGYPRGLGGNRLGALGQLLAVAELAASLLAPGDDALAWLRLGVVLRLNKEKLNDAFAASLLAALPRVDAPAGGHPEMGAAIEILIKLSIAFQDWKATRDGAANPLPPLVAFIDKRMDRLGRNLADVGIDLEYWQELDSDIEQDPRSLSEIKLAAREGLWQLFAIADEARRRWVKLPPASPAATAWLQRVEALPR